MKILSVVGARPNFMKIAPFINAINEYNRNENGINVKHLLVHTGQHYDDRMSKTFFEVLNIPQPDINLEIGSGSHAEQVGLTMIAFEKVLENEKPDWVIVVGDVNATLACSVTAKKQHIKVCHIEAGLRSGDMDMPEEINRLVTDKISDLLLTPDEISSENLKKEGITDNKIKFVGNIMIDTLENNYERAKTLLIDDIVKQNLIKKHIHHLQEGFSFDHSLIGSPYALVTLHRPSNVDQEEVLKPIIQFLSSDVSKDLFIIWPVHPRTQKQLERFKLWSEIMGNNKFVLLNPVGYLEMLRLNIGARIILTDSGGLQEESTVLGTPCLTLRWNTERPVTLMEYGGTSVLVGNNIERIKQEYKNTMKAARKSGRPPLWDGKTATRCLEAIINFQI